MRGAFLIVMAIALLIVGILVVKNLQTDAVDGVRKKEAVERAEEAAEALDDAMKKIKKSAREAAED